MLKRKKKKEVRKLRRQPRLIVQKAQAPVAFINQQRKDLLAPELKPRSLHNLLSRPDDWAKTFYYHWVIIDSLHNLALLFNSTGLRTPMTQSSPQLRSVQKATNKQHEHRDSFCKSMNHFQLARDSITDQAGNLGVNPKISHILL